MWGKGSVQIQFFVHKEVHQEIPGNRNDEIDERQKTQQTVGTFRKLYMLTPVKVRSTTCRM